MLSAFTNIFRIPELKSRLLFTLAMIVLIRAGAHVPISGIDATLLQDVFQGTRSGEAGGGMMALLNVFSGGALTQCAIFSLGIMPYISASIMMQLMSAVFPRLAKLRKEDGGQQKISQYTRYITLALCLFQGYLLAVSLENPAANPLLQGLVQHIPPGQALVPEPGLMFRIMTVITVTAGTMLLMWMGDQVTERGVGNGTSIIITVNILSSLPAALISAWKQYVPSNPDVSGVSRVMIPVILVAFLFLVVAAVIAITQAVRKIAVHYAKRVVGRKMIGGQSTFLPLKVNYAGVMPIIFAQALIVFPSMIITMVWPASSTARAIEAALNTGIWHYVFTGFMIFFFSYFWVATQFQPTQIADDLKRHNGYVPGIRPGKPTAEFLDYTMTRLTFAGAIFLTLVAVLPSMLSTGLQVPSWTAQFFGGTSLLIIVGVLLDTMRQVETHLIQRHYDGFLRKGKIRGRNQNAPRRGSSSTKVLSDQQLVTIYAVLALFVILFIVALVMRGS